MIHSKAMTVRRIKFSENYDPGNYRPEKLHPEHIECLCKALENSCDIGRLTNFLSNFSSDHHSHHPCREQLLRAKALVLFHEREFDDFYALVEGNQFSSHNHSFLQTETQRGKKLDPVSRYRVRKKNPFPKTIWDGEGTSYCFRRSAREKLKSAYRKHETPTQAQKQELAKCTQLSVVQVSNWFKNQRQRARQHKRECRSSSSSSSTRASSEGAESEQENEEESCSFEALMPTRTEEIVRGDCGRDKNLGAKRPRPQEEEGSTSPSANEPEDESTTITRNAFYSAAAAAAQIYYGTTAAHQHHYQQQLPSQQLPCPTPYPFYNQQQPIQLTMNFPAHIFNTTTANNLQPQQPRPNFVVESSADSDSLKYQAL